MTVATYGPQYYQYPVFTAEDGLSFEGAMKRFKTMPTPEDVFKKALLGLPKILFNFHLTSLIRHSRNQTGLGIINSK